MYKNSHEHVHINVTKMKQPTVFYVFFNAKMENKYRKNEFENSS